MSTLNSPTANPSSAVIPPPAKMAARAALLSPIAPANASEHPPTFDSWEHALAEINKHFCYILKPDVVVRLSDRELLDPQRFASRQYVNWLFKSGESVSPAAKKWIGDTRRNQKDRITYAPGKPVYHDGALNRWRGLASTPKQGDLSPWNELLDFLFPGKGEQRKYFEQWLAYPLQYPGAKLKTAVVLYSRVQGIGKNILVEAVERIYGTNAVEIGERELYGDFNSWQKDRQFIVGDEVQGGQDRRKVAEQLKRLITSPTFEINEKYKPQISLPNVANFIFLSNNPDPFYIADEDRRFWAWDIPQERALPDLFYQKFHDWKESEAGIAALHHHLLHIDLAGFNPNAKAPLTELKREMIELGRTDVERWLLELAGDDRRTLYTSRDLEYQFRRCNPNSNSGQAAILRAVKQLGFKQAYSGSDLKCDGKKIRLWVIAESAERDRLLAIQEPSDLTLEYKRQSARTML